MDELSKKFDEEMEKYVSSQLWWEISLQTCSYYVRQRDFKIFFQFKILKKQLVLIYSIFIENLLFKELE